MTVEKLIAGYGEGFPTIDELFGLEPNDAKLLSLSQPIPELDRYLKDVAFLKDVTSQKVVAIVRMRVLVAKFIALSRAMDRYDGALKDTKVVHSISEDDQIALKQFPLTCGDVVRAEFIERFTEHDTAAAGDYMKFFLARHFPHLESMAEGMAFADTSEDTMGPVFGLIGNSVVFGHFLPTLLDLMESILNWTSELEKREPLVLPAWTHKQAAEPSTLAKKMTTSLNSVEYCISRMTVRGRFIPFSGKFGGATGNITTHYAAYPDFDWRSYAREFIIELGLSYDPMTFQCSLYHVEVNHFMAIANMVSYLIKLVEDFKDMCSCPGQLFVKRKKKGTRGSSIMPGKTNLWGFEGAIAMLRRFQSDLIRMALALPDFPHEGDMGRSYLMRSIGGVFMPAFIAMSRIGGELVGDMVRTGCIPNERKIVAFFHEYPGMAGGTIQTILKMWGIGGDAYREIEAISIKPDSSYADATEFAQGLEDVMAKYELPAELRDLLRSKIDPANNIGEADKLAKECGGRLGRRITRYRKMLLPYNAPLI